MTSKYQASPAATPSLLLSHKPRWRTHLHMKTNRKLTRMQEDVLYIVKEHGPVSARDVAYHLPISEESARGVLNRLEAKSLIDATYTNYGSNRRAYV